MHHPPPDPTLRVGDQEAWDEYRRRRCPQGRLSFHGIPVLWSPRRAAGARWHDG
ncbi:hypothetical protein HMPREF9057_00872 [Actinomyces sp. oral taxon 171 str. F0337]|nr:hypothetical protein HMPREF9057_00872 [Actinomyces sp. oral taxon 171 str. F0337]